MMHGARIWRWWNVWYFLRSSTVAGGAHIIIYVSVCVHEYLTEHELVRYAT